jgi:predicted transcriptional regulator
MTKKQEFINFVEMAIEAYPQEMSENAKFYWEAFKGVPETEKPALTDSGKMILKFLRENESTPMWKSRDIAEGMFVGSRTVAGAMRKLTSDGFVEKISQDPAVYALTEKGKNFVIED